MRLAYVVDVHDRYEAVSDVLSRTGPVDVLVVGGDITTGGTPDEVERAIELWRPLAPTLLAVAGNMDSPAIDARLADLGVSIGGRGVVIDDVGLAGISAAPISPLNTIYEVSEEELARNATAALADVEEARVRLVFPHAPPYGTACDRLRSGEHVGSRAVREAVERARPDALLCGHIHEARGIDELGTTTIANPGPAFAGHYALVEIDDDVTVALD